MWEMLISMAVFERVLLLICVVGLLAYLLTILSRKNIVRGKDGISITDVFSGKKETFQLKPVWSTTIDDKDSVGFYNFGNYTKFFGQRWNSVLHREGFLLVRQIADPSFDFGNDLIIGYTFWVFDISDCNIQSSLLSLIVDKARQFERIVVVVKEEDRIHVKTISPENSVLKNIHIVQV